MISYRGSHFGLYFFTKKKREDEKNEVAERVG